MGFNQYPPRPSLIREGIQATHFLKGDSEKVLSKRQTIRLWTCHYAPVAQSHNYPSPLLPLPQAAGIMKREKKSAFTLAEVLITLGIIGVVAAMTMPSLITNYQKKETLSKLKKIYSIFSQVVKQAELNEGESGYWDFTLSSKDFYTKYLKQYLNVANEYIDKPLPKDMDYYTLNGGINNPAGGHEAVANPKVFLNDGTFFTMLGPLGNSYSIVVNLNGYSHPNRWGRDIFAFSIVQGKGFVPYGLYTGLVSPDTGEVIGSFGDSMSRDEITGTGNSRACNKEKDGIWCAALIMFDGWEIKDDYPW